MKPTRLLVVVVLFAVLAAGTVAFTVRAMRSLPEWYATRAAVEAEEPEAEPPPSGLMAMLGGLLGIETRHASSLLEQLNELATTGRVELDETRLAAVLETSMSSNADGRAVMEALDRPLARIAGDTIEFGGALRLDAVDTARMSQEAAANVERIRGWFPALADRTIYVGVRAVPRAQDGALLMSEQAALVLGRVALPAWLLPLGDLREQLDVDLQAVNLTRAEVVDGRLVLEAGAARSR